MGWPHLLGSLPVFLCQMQLFKMAFYLIKAFGLIKPFAQKSAMTPELLFLICVFQWGM